MTRDAASSGSHPGGSAPAERSDAETSGSTTAAAIESTSSAALDLRADLKLIVDLVPHGSRVLDIGCGTGDLLFELQRVRGVDARGVELSMDGVYACVTRGLSVVQGDADADLVTYPAASFDVAILSHTLQAIFDPRGVIDHLVRIARYAIVSFSNFGHWRVRWSLLSTGRMPLIGTHDRNWWDTPNIRACTISDFVLLCRDMGISIDKMLIVDEHGVARAAQPGRKANMFGEQAVFVLSRSQS